MFGGLEVKDVPSIYIWWSHKGVSKMPSYTFPLSTFTELRIMKLRGEAERHYLTS